MVPSEISEWYSSTTAAAHGHCRCDVRTSMGRQSIASLLRLRSPSPHETNKGRVWRVRRRSISPKISRHPSIHISIGPAPGSACLFSSFFFRFRVELVQLAEHRRRRRARAYACREKSKTNPQLVEVDRNEP
jgi:hypothetical protein